ncbi:MAG TPA: DUF6629 family protein [Candidatus Babeliales bacterium]|jgi:hypothetical protein|nr:DUF6629 family protein [Candidatus Babeliales bacterium]
MCFSAKASFIANAALAVCGVAIIKKSSTKKLKPLAAIPFAFAVQQALEGMVWVTINHSNTDSILHLFAMYGFLFFATIWWPAYMPWVFYIIESDRQHKKWLWNCVLAGIIVASIALLCMIFIGYNAQVIDHHIAYLFAKPYIPQSLYYICLLVYLYATAGSMLISSIPYMRLFGFFIMASCIIVHIGWPIAFGSLWCFIAAIGMMGIYTIIAHQESLIKKRYYT